MLSSKKMVGEQQQEIQIQTVFEHKFNYSEQSDSFTYTVQVIYGHCIIFMLSHLLLYSFDLTIML